MGRGERLRTEKIRTECRWHKSVVLTADNCYALADNGYTLLKQWKVQSGRHVRSYKGIWLDCSISLSTNGLYAMSASGQVALWELATGKCLRTFIDPGDYLTSISFSADNHYFLTGGRSGSAKLWEVSTGRILHTFDSHLGKVNSVCLSLDGRYAISGSDDATIKLWALDWELEEKNLLTGTKGPGNI